jgi:hypothetical protein
MVRFITSAAVTAFAAFALAGCLTTQEMPLAPNVVRIDTQAGGWLFTGQTVPATMRAAAKAVFDSFANLFAAFHVLLFGIDRQVAFFNEHTFGFRFQMRHRRRGIRDLRIYI